MKEVSDLKQELKKEREKPKQEEVEHLP